MPDPQPTNVPDWVAQSEAAQEKADRERREELMKQRAQEKPNAPFIHIRGKGYFEVPADVAVAFANRDNIDHYTQLGQEWEQRALAQLLMLKIIRDFSEKDTIVWAGTAKEAVEQQAARGQSQQELPDWVRENLQQEGDSTGKEQTTKPQTPQQRLEHLKRRAQEKPNAPFVFVDGKGYFEVPPEVAVQLTDPGFSIGTPFMTDEAEKGIKWLITQGILSGREEMLKLAWAGTAKEAIERETKKKT